MNPQINILNSDFNIFQNMIIEASAGTGKTFTIENLFVRLILEPHFIGHNDFIIDPEKILIVTFTKLATSELKLRILKKLKDFHLYIESEQLHCLPEYIVQYLQKSDSKKNTIIYLIKKTIASFEEIPISTIHSFCLRILLESPLSYSFFTNLQNENPEQALLEKNVIEFVKDFLRTEISKSFVSDYQLKSLLDYFKNDVERLVKKIGELIQQRVPIKPAQPKKELIQIMNSKIKQIKNSFSFSQKKIYRILCDAAYFFNKTTQNGSIKEELLKDFSTLSEILSSNSIEETSFDLTCSLKTDPLSYFKNENKNKRKKITKEGEHSLEFISYLYQEIYPVIEKAKDPNETISHMAYHCNQLYENYLKDNNSIKNPDELVDFVKKNASNTTMLKQIASNFDAIIVDEFQDTDLVQWHIFQKCFIENPYKKILGYFVGDPKQSIYAFRNADVYTYIKAKSFLGTNCTFSLSTNYRSSRSLVEALNLLFSKKYTPFFLFLPKLDQLLPIESVGYRTDLQEDGFTDSLGSIHFILCSEKNYRINNTWPSTHIEQKFIFPNITNKILKHHHEEHLSLDKIAILVKDRYQAQRIKLFLQKNGISSNIARGLPITQTVAFENIIDLFSSITNPSNRSLFKVMLSGKIWGFEDRELLDNTSNILIEKAFEAFLHLIKVLKKQGFGAFFETLLYETYPKSYLSIAESILLQEDGEEFFQHLQQIGEMIISQEYRFYNSAMAIYNFLLQLKSGYIAEKNNLQVRLSSDFPTVTIMTTHMSKGLEFDIVFATGLTSRIKNKMEMIPEELEGNTYLINKKYTPDQGFSFNKEIDAEKSRQFYVAITRAKIRCYIPYVLDEVPTKPEYGTASPLDIFWSQHQSLVNTYEELYEQIQFNSIESIQKKIDHLNNAHITFENAVEKDPIKKYAPIEFSEVLEIAPFPKIYFQSDQILSYSSLAHETSKENREKKEHSFMDFPPLPSLSIHSLPKGAQTGIILHKIIEEVDWNPFITRDKHYVETIVCKHIIDTPLFLWKACIIEMIENLFLTPIQAQEETFCLQDINPNRVLKETEFIYYFNQSLDGCNYIKGFIDAIVEYKDNIYIIDWKSNYLGIDTSHYSLDKLKESIEQMNYQLQANIYAGALKKQLDLVGLSEKKLKGALYIFLRGIDSEKKEGYGVYFMEIDPKKLQEEIIL